MSNAPPVVMSLARNIRRRTMSFIAMKRPKHCSHAALPTNGLCGLPIRVPSGRTTLIKPRSRMSGMVNLSELNANDMAARKKVIIPEKPQFRCRDCAESYDWHSKAIDGHLILCRCKQDHKTEHGRWCKFLNDIQCEHFKPRKNE